MEIYHLNFILQKLFFLSQKKIKIVGRRIVFKTKKRRRRIISELRGRNASGANHLGIGCTPVPTYTQLCWSHNPFKAYNPWLATISQVTSVIFVVHSVMVYLLWHVNYLMYIHSDQSLHLNDCDHPHLLQYFDLENSNFLIQKPSQIERNGRNYVKICVLWGGLVENNVNNTWCLPLGPNFIKLFRSCDHLLRNFVIGWLIQVSRSLHLPFDPICINYVSRATQKFSLLCDRENV